MLIPGGIAMNFSDGHNIYMIYKSYFSIMPIGYGNWVPIITAVLSIIILLMHFKNMKKGALIFQSICTVTSLWSCLMYVPYNGLLNVTVIGVMISILNITALILQIIFYKYRKEAK